MVIHQTQFIQARMMVAFYACACDKIAAYDPRNYPDYKDEWTFWARIWFMCREYIDDDRYPHNIRADSHGPYNDNKLSPGISITDVSFDDLMVAYYG